MSQACHSDAQNRYQARTSLDKLRGQYYTPEAFARRVLEELSVTLDTLVVDPACGDGAFLRGAVAAVARRFVNRDPKALAALLAKRLIGFDSNENAVEQAKAALREAVREYLGVDLSPDLLRIYPADLLASPDLDALMRRAGVSKDLYDTSRLLIVGNPPYVEAKRLSREAKAGLKSRYPDAVCGAPDLYLYFLHVCLGWLRDGDALAFVLPNKFLVNANGRRIRERLLERGRLRGLWLATRAQLFPGASVYPIVLFAGTTPPGTAKAAPDGRSVTVRHVTRVKENELALGDPLLVSPDAYRATVARAFFPLPKEAALQSALERLLFSRSAPRLGEVLDICWSVSFHRSGLRERYVTPHPPPSPHARRFLGGGPFSGNGEVVRYALTWGGWWIDYDEGRLKKERNAVPPLSLFEQPKLVICQNGRTLRAAYDDQGYVLKDTFLCGLPRRPKHPLCRHLKALVGLLCSRAIHFFYSHVFYGGHVGGGYLHFLRSFLVDLPVGHWSSEVAETVAALVTERVAAPSSRRLLLEEAMERHVSEALGLSPVETAAIRKWADTDTNWQARERVCSLRSPLAVRRAAGEAAGPRSLSSTSTDGGRSSCCGA